MTKHVVYEEDLMAAGIPKSLLACRKVDLQIQLKHFIDRAYVELMEGNNAILSYEGGIERDRACVVLLKRLIAYCKNPEDAFLCLYEPCLVNTYAGHTFDDVFESTELWRKILTCKFLLLGCMDGGSVTRKLNNPCYSTILTERLSENLPTFIATELGTEDLSTFYGADVIRIIEGYFTNADPDKAA